MYTRLTVLSSCYTVNMLNTNDLEYLERRRDILNDIETVKQERDTRIKQLLETGASPTELAKASGLTRTRIYQIKDGRR